jgi:hypothetical protein
VARLPCSAEAGCNRVEGVPGLDFIRPPDGQPSPCRDRESHESPCKGRLKGPKASQADTWGQVVGVRNSLIVHQKKRHPVHPKLSSNTLERNKRHHLVQYVIAAYGMVLYVQNASESMKCSELVTAMLSVRSCCGVA